MLVGHFIDVDFAIFWSQSYQVHAWWNACQRLEVVSKSMDPSQTSLKLNFTSDTIFQIASRSCLAFEKIEANKTWGVPETQVKTSKLKLSSKLTSIILDPTLPVVFKSSLKVCILLEVAVENILLCTFFATLLLAQKCWQTNCCQCWQTSEAASNAHESRYWKIFNVKCWQPEK